MRAVVYAGYGLTPELTQVADPACPVDGVVIAVGATGVCRSDRHAWKGHDPVALPHIGGHELAGVVAEAGPEVTRWRVGDRVTVPFVCGCGRCEYCLTGDAQVCPRQTQPGFTGPGSFAELAAVHAAARDYPAMMEMVTDGTLQPGSVIGQVIGLEDLGAALAAMDEPASAAGMTVVRFPL